jgi:hypothetical protein
METNKHVVSKHRLAISVKVIINRRCVIFTNIHAGLKISFTGLSDKMSDDFEFGSDIYI